MTNTALTNNKHGTYILLVFFLFVCLFVCFVFFFFFFFFFFLLRFSQLYKLAEKDFQTKLDMLFMKHMYDVAINLAKQQQQMGSTEAADNLVEIYSQYASE